MFRPRLIALAGRRLLAAAPMLPLAVVLAVAACAPAAPAIEQVSPNKGEGGVAGDTPIRVTFDRPMDRQSVVSRFELDPAVAGCDPQYCPITWSDRTMIFSHPRDHFQPDTKYTVHIKPGYRDSAGRVNNIEHAWEFRSETAPALQSANPASDAGGVAPDVDIVLQYSRPMQVPTQLQLKLIDAESDVAAGVPFRVSLDPGDQSRVVIAPLHLLQSRHRYRLSLTSDFEDVRHNATGRNLSLPFSTGDADLTRSLAFTVLDSGVAQAHRVAVLRPPATLGAPAPSLRVVYESSRSIIDYGWSDDARHIYTLEGSPAELYRVDVATGSAIALGTQATSMAVSPGADEVAYVAPDRSLHLWKPAATAAVHATDIVVTGAGSLVRPPSWSGDGRRLALAIDAPDGPALAILDRDTLSRFVVAGVRLATGGGGPKWSFDGTAVAFERTASGADEVWTFRPLAPQGSGLSRVGRLSGADLAWSNDGSEIYAAVVGPGQGSQPALLRAPAMPVDGQSAGFTALAGSTGLDSAPAIPSFDRRVAFLRVQAGLPQLYTVNGDGSGLVQLTFTKYYPLDNLLTDGVSLPRWAPSPGTVTP